MTPTMRYLSLCSGIEAATVAWHHLGWTPVAFSEIEPFPAAVLKHHYPNVPNYGDMTQHENWPIKQGDIDLLVAGTPCQAFSVAGLRQGLRDPRGGLMLVYLQIAQRLRPRWLLWENVPGVLSSNGGRDFGSLLGGLSELGYGWAYRVLDCQYVRTRRFPRAIPQRRRRVFLVAHCLERSAGDWMRPAKVLFDAESLSGHLAPQRQAVEGVAPDAPRRLGSVREWDERQVSATVCSKWSHGGGPAGNEYHNLTVAQWRDGSDVAPTILRKTHEQNMPDIGQFGALLQAVPIQDGREMQKAQNGVGIGQQGDPAYTLDATGAQAVAQAVAFHQNQNGECFISPVGFTVGTTGNASARNTSMAVVGTDCYNGTITGDVAATMGTPGSSVNASGPTVMSFHPTQDPISDIEVAHCMGTGGSQGSASIAVAFTQNQREEVREIDVPGALSAQQGTHQQTYVAQAMSVRRLTPTECERLQGFPDGYTAIPWRNKPADQCPDGPRYKALGNSMATNCMEWIGERIHATDLGGA